MSTRFQTPTTVRPVQAVSQDGSRAGSVSSVRLRAATMRDARLLWRWANDPVARAGSLDTAAVPWEHHLDWLTRALACQDLLLLIGEHERQPVGLVRFEKHGEKLVISVNVAPEARGQGLGRHLIALGTSRAMARWRVPVEATIRVENTASIRAFEHAGYRFVRYETRNGIRCGTYVASP